jgi:predicted dehydrogenase
MTKKNGASRKKIRYAVVGQGWISQEAILPAFAHAGRNSTLAALVSGDERKLAALGRKYGVKSLYTYDEYDDCLEGGEIDAVYIALPNDKHEEYALRAIQAGVHVLCEKPLAIDEAQCRRIVRAAERVGVKLMTAYRLHLDPANLAAVEVIRSGQIGEPRFFGADFAMNVEGGNIRVDAARGGGTLFDIGIYCINAARYFFRAEPTEVFAMTASRPQRRFSEVEEMASCILRFPGERLAHFTVCFGSADVGTCRIVGTKGDICIDAAFAKDEPIEMWVTRDGATRPRTFAARDQFAGELAYFSDCILEDHKPEPSGLEGMIDVAIIQGLYRSARTGRPVRLKLPTPGRRPTAAMAAVRKPKVRKRQLVGARNPAGEDE